MIGDKKVFESTKPSRDVWGNFNGRMVDAFLVNLSEISANEFKDALGVIKGLITDPTITINEKCVKPFTIRSYHHFIASTNKDAVKPSKNDRRNCLIRCSDELIIKNQSEERVAEINAYLKKMYAMIADDDSIKTIYEWLKSIPDLEDFFTVAFPATEYQKTMTELDVSPIELWLRNFVIDHHEETKVEMSTNELYTFFNHWKNLNDPNYNCNLCQFGVRLSLFNKTLITTKHTNMGNKRVLDISGLHKILFKQ